MSNSPTEPDDPPAEGPAAETVEKERGQLKDFVKGLSGEDVRSGNWFSKLLSQALGTYTAKVDAAYFQQRYPGVPADAVVEARIAMAANYAAIEGGLSATAYTGAIAATLGSLGSASPIALPAAGVTMLVDVAFLTQLQLRLAYDISALYRVPLDINDPADLWKLIRVAFTIKGGEVAREGATKIVPLVLRPVIKRFYSGPVLATARGLPVVGRHLLQRNLLKIGIPGIGVPLSVLLNRYTTLLAGRHARVVFRNDARIIELAQRLSARTRHPQTLLWVAWMVTLADAKVSDDEGQLMRHLIRTVRDHHGVDDEGLRDLVDLDVDNVWARIVTEKRPLDDLVDAAVRVAECDGKANAEEQRLLDEFRERCQESASTDGSRQ